MLYYENKFLRQGFETIIGVDEAGRGPLAGPVVAAAVNLKKKQFQARIDDSKKLTPCQREKAYPEIINNSNFGLGIVSESVIDRINILNATRLAMQQALQDLFSKLEAGVNKDKIQIIVDGNMRLDTKFPCMDIVRGDGKSLSIAAASILAKVTRDRLMLEYDKVYPEYGFLRHKGYGTAEHIRAIRKLGLSKIHRRTFCCD